VGTIAFSFPEASPRASASTTKRKVGVQAVLAADRTASKRAEV
jgi:hypothetical protein